MPNGQRSTHVSRERRTIGACAGLIPCALVVTAAIVGVDLAAVVHARIGMADRAAVATIRTFGTVKAVGLESATGLGWTAAALILLIVARRGFWSHERSGLSRVAMFKPATGRPSLALLRKIAISYHVGGLYGP